MWPLYSTDGASGSAPLIKKADATGLEDVITSKVGVPMKLREGNALGAAAGTYTMGEQPSASTSDSPRCRRTSTRSTSRDQAGPALSVTYHLTVSR